MSGKLDRCGFLSHSSLLLIVGLLVCVPWAQAQTARPATDPVVKADQISEGGTLFKFPKDHFPANFPDFNGVLFLEPGRPAGMFVTYMNDSETAYSLQQRARATLVKMFIYDKDVPDVAWNIRSLLANGGDSVASLATYVEGEAEVQIASYERTERGRLLVYGYFAMRNKSGNCRNGRFLDEQGEGVEEFDKFRQSFGGNKK